jgi:hypothetical protein
MTTTASKPSHSDARFKRTVERIAGEAYWLHTYQSAIGGMKGVHAIGLDFFRVSLNALKDARLVRLIRVLEDDSQTASFWYLLQSNARLVRKAAKHGGLDLVELRKIADSLVGIRNKTFIHIDKDGVFDPQSYYKAAGLNNDQVERIVNAFWATMRKLRFEVFGEEIEGDDYAGTDVRELASLRDRSSA